MKSLAIKYRPKTFDDVVEQGSIITILTQQLQNNETKNAYLFCGGAGTGKTTCARIFANEINKHQGNPIEMDAASNSGVDDVREIINQAQTKSLDSEFKVFIIDECHSISNTGWQAFLKLIEEPPAKSIFIFCTTDPQKIPRTILSRVQRYDFQRISHDGVVARLKDILHEEAAYANNGSIAYNNGALDYISKLADGGMRDAITLLDKCLAYNSEVTLENVLKALGIVEYDTMISLTDAILSKDAMNMVQLVEEVHRSGKELKQFIKTYTTFALDLNKYICTKSFDFVDIPSTYSASVDRLTKDKDACKKLLSLLLSINSAIKWDASPKHVIEAMFMEDIYAQSSN